MFAKLMLAKYLMCHRNFRHAAPLFITVLLPLISNRSSIRNNIIYDTVVLAVNRSYPLTKDKTTFVTWCSSLWVFDSVCVSVVSLQVQSLYCAVQSSYRDHMQVFVILFSVSEVNYNMSNALISQWPCLPITMVLRSQQQQCFKRN